MSIKLLTSPTNYAICKMEERKFPGIVVQGDSFFSLLRFLKRTNEVIKEKFESELEDQIIEIGDYIELYEEIIFNYEKICLENGFILPYNK